MNEILTPTLLPIPKSQEDEWHSLPHCCNYRTALRVNDLLTPTLLPIQGSQDGEWLTHSHSFAYTKSKKGEWVTHFHTVACKKEPRGWMTYSLPNCCLYKRTKRLNDLFTPTLLPIEKSQEGEQLTHSHTFVYTKEVRGWMTYSITQCSLYKRRWFTYSLQYCCLCERAKRVNDLLSPILLSIQTSQEGE